MPFEIYIPVTGSGVMSVAYPAVMFRFGGDKTVKLQFNWTALKKAGIERSKLGTGLVLLFDAEQGHVAFTGYREGQHPAAARLNINGYKKTADGGVSGTPFVSATPFARLYGLEKKRLKGQILKVTAARKSDVTGFALPGYSWQKVKADDLIPGVDDDLIDKRSAGNGRRTIERLRS